MMRDMDIECSAILARVTLKAKGCKIFDRILATASRTQKECKAQGFDAVEFVSWLIGAVTEMKGQRMTATSLAEQRVVITAAPRAGARRARR